MGRHSPCLCLVMTMTARSGLAPRRGRRKGAARGIGGRAVEQPDGKNGENESWGSKTRQGRSREFRHPARSALYSTINIFYPDDSTHLFDAGQQGGQHLGPDRAVAFAATVSDTRPLLLAVRPTARKHLLVHGAAQSGLAQDVVELQFGHVDGGGVDVGERHGLARARVAERSEARQISMSTY